MSGQSLQELLKVATEAVDLARSVLDDARSPGAVVAKGDRDMATAMDFEIERRVRAFLAEATPEFGFLGEEEGQSGLPGADRPFWVLDPIDGTANFTHGLPLYAVSLGLVEGEQSTVAVVDVPGMNERFEATKGGGARLNGSPIRASQTSHLSEAVVAIGDYAVGANAAERNRPRLALTAVLAERVQRVRMLGSAAIDLTWVACGRLDASIMLSNKPWDTTAGALLARESGAKVQDLAGSRHSLASATTLAAAAAIRDELMQVFLRPSEP